jgi:hypothetical protein
VKAMPGQDELNQVAVELRDLLKVPEDWVQVFGDQEDGFVVGLALNMIVEDEGTGETGPFPSAWPSRFSYIGKSGDAWFAKVYEHGKDESYDDREAVVEIKLHVTPARSVAQEVAKLTSYHARFRMERA